MDVTKPCKFTGFGAMDVTKPYKVIGFGAILAASLVWTDREPLRTGPSRAVGDDCRFVLPESAKSTLFFVFLGT